MGKANVHLALGLLILTAAAGCQQQWVYDAERNQHALATGQYEEVHYSVPPQVVYRIDDHRFVTLEDYNHCLGYAWYNDTRSGVRTKIGLMWPTGFHGGIINGDPTGKNLVFPTVSRNVCGDRGCVDYMAYSTDAGKTFSWVRYDKDSISFDPVKSSKDYAMAVNSDRLYVMRRSGEDGNAYVDQYPMVPGIDLNKPYPKDIKGDSFIAFSRPGFLAGVRTPSGADHYTCDASINDPKAPQP
jgi:hypothetical protein